jgi:PTH1 family peptidyl-tRNA hydrolase
MFSFFKKNSFNDDGPIDYAIVGLGNPGKSYENTRHNAGFLALDYLASQSETKIDNLKFKSLCKDIIIKNNRVLLVKPQTFMNLSGQSVIEVMNFYKLPVERVLVIFDDISLDVGMIRIKPNGSGGGHNGMKNIIYLSGKENFPRIRIGVGAKPSSWDLKDWVVSRFSREEQEVLIGVNEKVLAAVNLIINGKISDAMNLYNKKLNKNIKKDQEV